MSGLGVLQALFLVARDLHSGNLEGLAARRGVWLGVPVGATGSWLLDLCLLSHEVFVV